MCTNLVGKKVGKLTVLNKTIKKNKQGKYLWLCECECGNTKLVGTDKLSTNNKQQQIRSCGCLRTEASVNAGHKLQETKELKEYQKRVMVENTKLDTLSSKPPITNKSGTRGVHFDKAREKWTAYITFKGKRKHLGRFIDKKDAIKARKEAEEKYFKPILDKYGVGDTTGE